VRPGISLTEPFSETDANQTFYCCAFRIQSLKKSWMNKTDSESSFSNDDALMFLGGVLKPERIVIHDLTSPLNQ